jgi:hypothetical protein
MTTPEFSFIAPDLHAGDKVKLSFPDMWRGYGCDVIGTYTILEKKDGSQFGCGIGCRVTPALQPNHPDKEDCWYDLLHFKLAEETNAP